MAKPAIRRSPKDVPASLDEIFRATGLLAHHAALADRMQFEAFMLLTGLDEQRAQAVYYALSADAPKREMMTRLAGLVSADAKSKAKALSDAVTAVTTPRNSMAHTLVSGVHDDPGKAHLHNFRNMDEPTVRATQALLASKIRESGQAVERTRVAFDALCLSLGVTPP